MNDQFQEVTKDNGLKNVTWGSDEFIQKLQTAETYNPPNPNDKNDYYVRPLIDKNNIKKLSECDMTLVQPLLDMGLWVKATNLEVSIWKSKQREQEGLNATRVYSSGASNTGS